MEKKISAKLEQREKLESLRESLYETLVNKGFRPRNWTSTPGFKNPLVIDEDFYAIELEAQSTEYGLYVVIRCPVFGREDAIFVERVVSGVAFMEAREHIFFNNEENLDSIIDKIVEISKHGIAISRCNQKNSSSAIFSLDNKEPDLPNGSPEESAFFQYHRNKGMKKEAIENCWNEYSKTKQEEINYDQKVQKIILISGTIAFAVGATMGFEGMYDFLRGAGVNFDGDLKMLIEGLIREVNRADHIAEKIGYRTLLPGLFTSIPSMGLSVIIMDTIKTLKADITRALKEK